ncbi:MAG: hypothetical protein IJQ28_07560 [Clostridia bacterium]|nr:hypothetical protein [Clostridia bacterium]
MRLSSRLSDKDKNHGEVEAFINLDRYTSLKSEETNEVTYISAGDFIEIQIGKINIPFYSTICEDSNSFISPKKLHCLIINEKMVSIDCQLKCTDFDKDNPKCQKCTPYIQAWFLVEADDIFSNNPDVKLVKQSFRLPNNIKLPIELEDKFSEWLAKAEIAYKERLGVGAAIYLRSIFEVLVNQIGKENNIKKTFINKWNKEQYMNFEQYLEAVDNVCKIIPEQYSKNGYSLFRELSNIAHGNCDEDTALDKYDSLRRLVIGVIENVKKKNEEIRNNIEIQRALNEIGFTSGGDENE